MSRIIVVANRLPVTLVREQKKWRLNPSSGGLATAMKGVLEQREGRWIGWPGETDGMPAEEVARVTEELRERHKASAVLLSASQVARYYDGFSNGVLWPLFHFLTERVDLDAESSWRAYREVNQRFAEAIAAELREGDRVWIHDYQLALVPKLLRELRPDAVIGYFLHVPFPSSEVFRILPWRAEILEGILGADVVGFHTASYRHNFALSASYVLGVELGVDQLTHDDRRVRLGVYPISIDTASIEKTAASEATERHLAQLRQGAAGRKIVLGVDRLDYTKGIPRRLLAFERLLERNPGLRSKVMLVQLAVPSREKVSAYADLRRTVNELVGRINSHHGTPTSSPIQMLYRSVSSDELMALYRAADVMLVTPLRDGMNLVAKEYVAARSDDRGALVLSEFAGAATELREALIVNPYDLSGMAQAITQALAMPESEQQHRMRAMREHVRTYDVTFWTRRFLDDLDAVAAPLPSTRAVRGSDALRSRLDEARQAPQRLLLLDYDGTLVNFAPVPELATPDPTLLALLQRLTAHPANRVHLVSGRPRSYLESWFGELPMTLHAEHGFWSRLGPGLPWVSASEHFSVSWKEPLRSLLDRYVRRLPGSFIEEKTSTLAFHYRRVDPSLAGEVLPELRHALEAMVREGGFELLDGKKVIEARLAGMHKGRVARLVLGNLAPEAVVIAAGDDRTDEDMFGALPPGAVSIKVGPGATQAQYRVESPPQLRRLLEEMARGATVTSRPPPPPG